MTALAPIASRIATIRQRIASLSPNALSFAGALQRAQTTAAAAGPAAPPEAAPEKGGHVVGILGTPVAVAPGTDFRAVAARARYSLPPPPAPGTASGWVAGLPERGRRYASMIDAAARRAGLDPRLMAAVVWAESSFKPDAVSHAGAIGLAQLMPGTAKGLGVDPWDPAQNVDGGARYLAAQIERFGSYELGLAAYNAGPGRVKRAGGMPNITSTRAYVQRVLGYFERLGGTR